MATTYNTTAPDNLHLPRWAYILLALLAGVIGLASSVVTTQFFIIGLERTEPDTLAKQALIAAGVLMIITELAAFALAALLPKAKLRALRWRLMACGFALLVFEASTIFVTSATLARSSESMAGSTSTRIADLRASIDGRRAAAAALRTNGAKQSESRHGWNRAAGASALGQSLDVERQIEPMAAELAKLQAGQVPTLSDTLGKHGMLAYSVARALLISIMGLVMFGAAGALLRAACAVPGGVTVASGVTAVPASKLASYTQPAIAPKDVPTGVSYRKAMLAAGVPLAAMGAAPMAHAAPHVPAQPARAPGAPAGVSSQAHSAPAGVPTQAHLFGAGVPEQAQSETGKTAKKSRAATAVPDGSKIDTGTTGNAAMRYGRVKAAVAAGSLKPSVRAIQAAEGGGGIVVRRYLQQLAADGVIDRAGRGWRAKL